MLPKVKVYKVHRPSVTRCSHVLIDDNLGVLIASSSQVSRCSHRRQSKLKTTNQETMFKGRGGVEDTRLEAKAKDTKNIRGQGQGQPFRGQTLSRPRTGMLEAKAKDQGHKAQVLSKKKKRSSQKYFKRSPLKNVFQKIFQPLHKILTFQKIVLSSSRGQANFRGLEVSRPKPRTSKSVLEAKDVLEDSTSVQR